MAYNMTDVGINRFVVYTTENPNVFTVSVSDLDRAIERAVNFAKHNIDFDSEDEKADRIAGSFIRAKFIEDAIQEKLDRMEKK